MRYGGTHIDKLMALRLPAFAETCRCHLGKPEFTALTFEDRLGLLVDAQWTQREQRKLRRHLRLDRPASRPAPDRPQRHRQVLAQRSVRRARLPRRLLRLLRAGLAPLSRAARDPR